MFSKFFREINPNNWKDEKLLDEPYIDDPNQFEVKPHDIEKVEESGFFYRRGKLLYLGEKSLKMADVFFITFIIATFSVMPHINF